MGGLAEREYEQHYEARLAPRNFLVSIDPNTWRLTEVFTGVDASRILAVPGDRIAWVLAPATDGADGTVPHEIVFESRRWPFEGRDRGPIRLGTSPSAVMIVARSAVESRGGWFAYKYSLLRCGTRVLDPDVVIGGPGQDLNDR